MSPTGNDTDALIVQAKSMVSAELAKWEARRDAIARAELIMKHGATPREVAALLFASGIQITTTRSRGPRGDDEAMVRHIEFGNVP